VKRFVFVLSVAAALVNSAGAAGWDIAKATATSAAVQEAERRVARECEVGNARQFGRALFYRVTVDCARAGTFVYDVSVRAFQHGRQTIYRATSVTAVGGPR
jgi:hypothetical protein